MWVCTFTLCVFVCSEDGERLGYGPNFAIYDDSAPGKDHSVTDIDVRRFPLIRPL